MKKSTVFIMMFLGSLYTIAQNPRTYYKIAHGWTDISLNGRIKGKFFWQIENQHRRQDMQGTYNNATTSGNLYHNLNQNIFRPYIHYQLNPNVRISLMPLGWVGSNKFKNGHEVGFFSELRVAPQVIVSQNLGRLRMDNRFRYEFRWFGSDIPAGQRSFLYDGEFNNKVYKNRFRYQMKLSLPINKPKMEDKTLYAQLYDEIFINIGPNVASTHLFDQNRAMIGLGFILNKFFVVEAGYIQQMIFKFNKDNNVDLNKILQVNFVINNIDQMFRK